MAAKGGVLPVEKEEPKRESSIALNLIAGVGAVFGVGAIAGAAAADKDAAVGRVE